jgi:uncharacterized protein (DUF983 family)
VRSRIGAIAGLRCPRCREGRVFAALFKMLERCPTCGLIFEREEGYFTGAMVVSYIIGTALYGGLALLLWRGLGWTAEVALAAASLVFLSAVPAIWRWSRVIWMHLDQAIDPQR